MAGRRERPHILILMPDQFRADAFGHTGNSVIKTPNLDRLALEGVSFTKAYTVSPLCMPARASFISGLYPHNHGIWWNAGRLPPGDKTLFHHLQRQGYFIAYIGKSHFYPHREGDHLKNHEGYMKALGIDYVHETTGPWATLRTDSYMTDYWETKGLLKVFREDYRRRREAGPLAVWPSPLPVEEFLDSYIGRQAVEFLHRYDRPQPFCLFVGFGGPHDPWDAPGEYATMYDPRTVPAPIPKEPVRPWTPPFAAEMMRKGRRQGLTEDIARQIRANYYGKISLIDHWVGEILSALEDRGWLDETFIIFWSDHGEMAGDHGRLSKSVFYEGSVRIPLILRHPDAPKGKRVSSLVELIDLYPTILEAIGADAPKQCLGRSLWGMVMGTETEGREYVLSEVHAFGHYTYMVCTGRYKYAVAGNGQGYLLFDLFKDPEEQVNLLGHPAYQDVEQELRESLLCRLIASQRLQGDE